MNKNIATVFAFFIGASIGAGGAYIYTKKKYDELIDKEVSSARETYQRLAKELADKNEEEKKKIFTEYTNHVSNYIESAINDDTSEEETTLSTIEDSGGQVQMPHEVKSNDISSIRSNIDHNTPYEIDDSEYGSIEDYDLVSLNYYTNEVITNDAGDILDDPSTIIGEALLEKLSVYEDNGIYMAYARNDIRRCDYEIALQGYDYDTE